MHLKLISLISKELHLNEKLQTLLEKHFSFQKISKNTIFEGEGQIPQFLYFVNDGYLRSFYYDKDGDEVTTYLAGPEQYMASFLSLSQQKISMENLETVTDCTLLRIKRDDFLNILDIEASFKNYSLSIFEQAFSKMNQRANDLATLTAEQRYQQLIKYQGNILQNVPIQYIASFLGIKPQSLSRIRKQMIK